MLLSSLEEERGCLPLQPQNAPSIAGPGSQGEESVLLFSSLLRTSFVLCLLLLLSLCRAGCFVVLLCAAWP